MEGENTDFFFEQVPQSKRDKILEQIQQIGAMIDKQNEMLKIQQETIKDKDDKIKELEQKIKEQDIKIREQEGIINGNNTKTRSIEVEESGLDPSWVITNPEEYQ